jgi:hypothetical protein
MVEFIGYLSNSLAFWSTKWPFNLTIAQRVTNRFHFVTIFMKRLSRSSLKRAKIFPVWQYISDATKSYSIDFIFIYKVMHIGMVSSGDEPVR